jgi:hypothetical protein
MLSLYLHVILAGSVEQKVLKYLPFVVNSLDDKSQGRADTVDILAHDLFHNGCLSCIIESAFKVSASHV